MLVQADGGRVGQRADPLWQSGMQAARRLAEVRSARVLPADVYTAPELYRGTVAETQVRVAACGGLRGRSDPA